MKQTLKHFILYGAALCVIGPGSYFEKRNLEARVDSSKTYVLSAPDTEMAQNPNVLQIFMDTGTELSSRPYAYIVPYPCNRRHNWALWTPWLWGRYGLRR